MITKFKIFENNENFEQNSKIFSHIEQYNIDEVKKYLESGYYVDFTDH